MQEIQFIDDIEQASVLMKPMRMELLQQLVEPRTCPELGVLFGESAQRIYYHIKALERAGLVAKVGERRVRGAVEGHYQATARSYWLSPRLVSAVGGPQTARDQFSLRVLAEHAETILEDVSRLARSSEAGEAVSSLSLSASVYLPDGARKEAFRRELQEAVANLARRYGTPGDVVDAGPTLFRLLVACYEQPANDQEQE